MTTSFQKQRKTSSKLDIVGHREDLFIHTRTLKTAQRQHGYRRASMLTSKLSFPASPLSRLFVPVFLFSNNARCVRAEASHRPLEAVGSREKHRFPIWQPVENLPSAAAAAASRLSRRLVIFSYADVRSALAHSPGTPLRSYSVSFLLFSAPFHRFRRRSAVTRLLYYRGTAKGAQRVGVSFA